MSVVLSLKMKKYALVLALRMLLTMLLAAVAGMLAISGYYWLAAVVCLIMVWRFVDVFRRAMRSVKDMKRLVDAIRFAELNLSFQPSIKKGLPEELAEILDDSLVQFRQRLVQTEANQLFYDTLLQRIDSGIVVSNIEGNIEWINKTAIEMFGKPQPRRLSDLKNISSELPEMLYQLVPREIKLLTIDKDAVPNRYAVTTIIFSAKGRELKLFIFKNIQSALEEQESDAWRKLIGVLTHEIMNSVTPIISLSETLSETSSAQTGENRYAVMNRAMQTIHRRSKGLIDFVKNYRQLTRIPEPVPTSIPAKEMLADITYLLKADGIVFSFHITPDDLQITADRGLIEQVLINLIKNAWDACGDTSHPNIEVDVCKNKYQKPVITVVDNGYGIIPEALDKIFVPFFTTKPDGSGIGLSICRQIMNLHHGSISIKSEKDKGTEVTLRF